MAIQDLYPGQLFIMPSGRSYIYREQVAPFTHLAHEVTQSQPLRFLSTRLFGFDETPIAVFHADGTPVKS